MHWCHVPLYTEAGRCWKIRNRVDIQLIDACQRSNKSSTYKIFQKTSRQIELSKIKRLKNRGERFGWKDKKYNKNWKPRFEGDYVTPNEYKHDLSRKKIVE